MQLTKFRKPHNVHTREKNLSGAELLSRSLTQTELQRNQLKHKLLLPQNQLAH